MTKVVSACDPTHLLVSDFMSNKKLTSLPGEGGGGGGLVPSTQQCYLLVQVKV